MTLIEVLGGLFLLSTLLVSILSAHRQQVAQIRRAERVHVAIEQADQQLAQWFTNIGDTPFPKNSSGFLNQGRFRWSTEVTDSSRLVNYGVETVRFKVIDRSAQSSPSPDDILRPLLFVDLFIVDPNWLVPPSEHFDTTGNLQR